MKQQIDAMRAYFAAGATLDVDFRIRQLKKLRAAIAAYEGRILAALREDLGKADFEGYEGKVVSIKEFGAFLEFAPGKEGMVHISKIAKERINHVEDVLTLGDKVTVVCLGKDKMGRVSFSIKDVK